MGLKAVYTEIEARLKLVKDLAGVVIFQHFHIWNNQFYDYMTDSNKSYSVPFPAVFIEIVVDSIEQMGNGSQMLNCTARLHIIHQLMNANGGEFEQNTPVLDIVDRTNLYMNKYYANGTCELVRSGIEQDFNHGNLYHCIVSYKFNYVDNITDEPIGGIDSEPPTDLELTITTN